MKQIFLISALLILPSQAGDLEDLKAAQERYEAAFKARDAAALARTLAPGYLEFTIDGDLTADWSQKPVDERQRYFSELLDKYESWDVRLQEMHYKVTGSTGLVSGKEWVTRKPTDGVLEYPRWRFTATWVKDGTGWRMAACHRSTFPATAPGARPLARTDVESRVLQTALGLPRWASAPMADARLLRVLVEGLNAKRVIEVGTSTGFSGLWIANGLRATGGRLTTFELDAGRAATALRQFELAGVAGFVEVIQGDAHENIRKLGGPVDMVFIDAEKDGYPDYLAKLLPLVRPGGLVVAHNMRWPAPSGDYVKAVTTNPDLETVFLNMDDQGLSVTLKKR